MFSLIQQPHSFTLLLAPPAWGKTRLIFSIFAEQRRPIFFVAPLKAVAWQFYQSAREENFPAYFPQSRGEVQQLWPKFRQETAAFWVITLERLAEFMLEGYCSSTPSLFPAASLLPLIVLDEFHLYYQWGDDFRPIMWEKAMLCGNSGLPILGLSGTMAQTYLARWQEDFKEVCHPLTVLNLGNFALKFWPQKITIFPRASRAAFKRRWLAEVLAAQSRQRPFTFLYFCPYREEVDNWLDFCQRWHIKALGCVGGKVDQFMEHLALARPECIFSTIALGHGVNLPPLDQIYLGLSLPTAASWWQMVGRGGRRGENYQLFCLGLPPPGVFTHQPTDGGHLGRTPPSHLFSKWRLLRNFIQAWLYDGWLRWKLWWYARPS